jgi:putative Ca2+/H+ antiporter (TMEM165/GDT1 family)
VDWNTLLSTLGLIFVAELGDKTQLAVVTQVCKHRRPWAVFLGASLALTAVTALGAIGGQALRHIIPDSVLQAAAALAFVAMGVLIGRKAARIRDSDSERKVCDCPESSELDCAPVSAWDWKAFSSTLGLLFVAELGDKTQLAVLSIAGRQGDLWSVFLGGTMALTVVTGLGVIGGQGMCKLIPERLLLWISAVAFVVMGVLTWLGSPRV